MCLSRNYLENRQAKPNLEDKLENDYGIGSEPRHMQWFLRDLVSHTFLFPLLSLSPEEFTIIYFIFSPKRSSNTSSYSQLCYLPKHSFFKKKIFYCCSITVVCIFSPPPTPAKPTSLSCFHPPPWFCPCVLYSSSWKPFSPLSPPHLPSGYC